MASNLQRHCQPVAAFGKLLAVLAAVGVLLLAGVASAQADSSPRFSYLVTFGSYSDTDDLDAAVKEEFGPDAEVAEWTEIKEEFGLQQRTIEQFALRIGLGWNEHLWVTYEGERIFPGTGLLGEEGRTRYYFLSRWNGNKPDNYEAHDQIQGDTLSLGSWYDVEWQILVKINR